MSYIFFHGFLQHTPLEKLDRKHFAKVSRGLEQNNASAVLQQNNSAKEIALMEVKMQRLCDLLNEVCWYIITVELWLFHGFSLIFCNHVQTIVQTKENIEKKQALTYEEMEAEREEVIFHFLLMFYSINSVLIH